MRGSLAWTTAIVGPTTWILLQEREDALASFTPVKELIEPETSWLALKLTDVGTKYQLLPRA